ncbi:MAG: hypothetical protein JJE30_15410 [Desulfuromonadales bacterium]|nr:hypothetical protein [Desulfuromonadales bacterium]
MKRYYRYVVAVCCLMVCSCAYTKEIKIREEFDQSVKGYNKMLRWRDMESAGIIYMDPELRDAFMKTAQDIKKRGVTITGYRILTTEYTPEKNSAEVVAEFDYYALPSNRIKTLTYRQNWSYLDTEEKKGWQLKSGLPAFE